MTALQQCRDALHQAQLHLCSSTRAYITLWRNVKLAIAAADTELASQPANRIGFCVCPRHDFAIVANLKQGCTQCNAEQLQTQPEPCAWLFDAGPGNEGASFFEIGAQQPQPETGFTLVPLYRASNVCQEARIEDQSALRKDAERYRWLRLQLNDESTPRIDVTRWVADDEVSSVGEGLRIEMLDAEIDAAIAAESAP
jgi:hypothetical protein